MEDQDKVGAESKTQNILLSIAKTDIKEVEAPRIRRRATGKRFDCPYYAHMVRGPFTFKVVSKNTTSVVFTTQMPLYQAKGKANKLGLQQMYNNLEEAWMINLRFESNVGGPYVVHVTHPRVHAFTIEPL